MSSCMMNMMATVPTSTTPANNGGQMFDSANLRPGSALSVASIENIVNPLGTVTTVVRSSDQMTDSFQSSDIAFPDQYIHENCDEGLFRPVVTILEQRGHGNDDVVTVTPQAPVRMNTNLIVPVIVPTISKAPVKVVVEAEKEAIGVKFVENFKEMPAVEVVKSPEPTPVVHVVMEETVPEPSPAVVADIKTTAPAKLTKQQQKNNKRNKEKTPPPQPTPPAQPQTAMVTSVVAESEVKTTPPPLPATKSNGSKGRKSSGQEPKAGKMRKSEKIVEQPIMMNVEEEVKERDLPLPPPPTPAAVSEAAEEDIVEVVVVVEQQEEEIPMVEERKPMPAVPPPADFDHLPEVEATPMPSKQDMEIIQDSLMKETIVEAVTVSLGGGGGGKKKKNRQKTPPKVVEPEPEPEPPAMLMLEEHDEKLDMMVDISDTKYDLTECMTGGDAEFDAMYADPLVPLEPFDPSVTFEAVECPDELEAADYVDESLMTFESPAAEKELDVEVEILTRPVDAKLEKLHKVFTDRNIMFAMCSSWREGSTDDSAENKMAAEHVVLAETEDVTISSGSGGGWQLEIHEDYMDMERSEKKLMVESMSMKMDVHKLSPVLTASTGSSEGEVSSSSNSDGKTTSSGHTTTTATEDDDEELQPLLKGKASNEQQETKFEVRKMAAVEKEEDEGNDDDEASSSPRVPSMADPKSKESTPTPQNKGSQGGSKKKSRKKKR